MTLAPETEIAAQGPRVRDVLDLLAAVAQSQVPLPHRVVVEYRVTAQTDLDGFQMVAQIAHRLGVTPVAGIGGRFTATRSFGQFAGYRAVYDPQAVAP